MNIIAKFHNWRRKMRWNRQYKSGRWANLKDNRERIRYETIIALITVHGSKNPSILDLGCGEGVLFERMKDLDYSYSLGMDFSSVSITNAKKLELKNAEFITADAHTFEPNKTFDVIVFNEAFYYIHDSEKQNVLNRMIKSLKPNGIVICSMFRESSEAWTYFNDSLEQIEFKKVITDIDTTYWKIGVYKTN
ncbi:MAG: class I SAM-dependent methyltransferase [Flavobacteriaceae bacterium]|nr:class I SAM-dependent methyltransferase [Flavobacteriaceae bacterium]